MPDIVVRIEKGTETAGDGREQQEAKREESKKQPVASPTTMLFYHQTIATGKQIVGYASSNIGNFTGNFLLQEQLTNTLDIISDLTTLSLGATKGWAGLAVAGIGVTTKRVLQLVSQRQEDKHIQNEQNYLLKRSGNSTTNGSRGTEN